MGYFGGGGVLTNGDNNWTGNNTFLDSGFSILDNGDNTKVLKFQASGISAGQTRTVTIPDSNTTLPIFSQIITFAGPTAARTVTFPDGNFTAASVQANNAWTASQTFTASQMQLSLDGSGGTNSYITMNGSGFPGLVYSKSQTPDTFCIATGPLGNSVLLCEGGDVDFDFAHAQQTNPTLFVHSAAQNTSQWVSLAHDGTNAILGVGTGNISIPTNTIAYNRTITTAGTTGNQTINKAAGTVNIAAAGSSVTVTNNLVTANSIVFAVLRTDDATATIKNVVPGAGSFVITLGAAATAEVSIGFLVTN